MTPCRYQATGRLLPGLEGLPPGEIGLADDDYAFARRFPGSARTVTILETPVPGIESWLNLNIDVPLWHGAFHVIPGLPEALVTGRQAVYFRYFFDTGTKDNTVISDADLKHYADAYGDPDRLRSAFEIYRALPANMAYNAERTSPTDIPLLLVGGEHVFRLSRRGASSRIASCLRSRTLPC